MPPLQPLPSLKAKLIRDLLRHKRTRDQERAFVIEGEKPVLELLVARPAMLRAVVVAESRLRKPGPLRQALSGGRAPAYVCRDSLFEQFSEVASPAGLLAVVDQPAWDQPAILQRPQVLGLYGECLQDPANVGAILRTALGFGLDALWLTPDSADIFNPKVVRATAGSVLALPVFTIADVGHLIEQGWTVLAAEPPGPSSRAIRDIASIPARSVLAFGNESRGLSDATVKRAALRFHIPVSPAIQSLNVAAAAAVAAFYFSRLPRVS